VLTGFGLRFDRAGGIGRRALLLVACFERLYALFQRVDLLQQCLVDRIVGTSLRRRVTIGRLRHFATGTHERGHRNDCRNLIGPQTCTARERADSYRPHGFSPIAYAVPKGADSAG
jgi:hypothetical protein